MSFPASLTLVTVAIQLDALPAGGGAGTVQFISPRTVPLQGTSLVEPIDKTVEIGADGAGSIALPAVDVPGWSPQGWSYTVIGRTARGSWRGTLQLLHTDTTVALHERLQIDGTVQAGESYLLLSQLGVAGGAASLDPVTGLVPADQLPPSSGGSGGAVDSVNGRTGAVTIVTADLTDSTTVGRAVVKAADAAAARTAIGAGTSSLALGTSSSTAAAGDAPAAAIAAHVAASDPHAQYALEASLGGAALLNVGTGAGTVAAGNDSRLSDARTPTAHAASHGDGGTDEIAVDASQVTTGTLAIARIPTGTSGTTVAAGNDSRITGAAQKASNLSDLASASTARTNLGLGGAATLAVGTSAGTVAAGDDSRITGAAQKASNLSDLGSASTARTNLGLGNSATRAVGTASTDVAAGDAPAAAVTAHTGASDPHPQYLVTYVESGGTYAIVNAARIFVGADDPAGKGFTLVDGDLWFPGA